MFLKFVKLDSDNCVSYNRRAFIRKYFKSNKHKAVLGSITNSSDETLVDTNYKQSLDLSFTEDSLFNEFNL